MTDLPALAYKILTAAQWAKWQADGVFSGAPVDLADGFVHLSTAEQLHETAARHFAGQTGLVVVEVNLRALGEAVRWEPSRGGALFPHVYCALPIAAVVGEVSLPRDADDPASIS